MSWIQRFCLKIHKWIIHHSVWESVMKKKDESFEFCDLHDAHVSYSNWSPYLGTGMVLSSWARTMMAATLYGAVQTRLSPRIPHSLLTVRNKKEISWTWDQVKGDELMEPNFSLFGKIKWNEINMVNNFRNVYFIASWGLKLVWKIKTNFVWYLYYIYSRSIPLQGHQQNWLENSKTVSIGAHSVLQYNRKLNWRWRNKKMKLNNCILQGPFHHLCWGNAQG